MRRASLVLFSALAFACSTPAPAPEPAPAPVAETPAPEQKPLGTVRVTATSLNVRAEASTTAAVVTQAKKGESLTLLTDKGDWMYVRTAAGETGWVSAAYVTFGSGSSSSGSHTAKRRTTGCETDYAFVKTPTPAFSDRGAHGLVVVEANVNSKGDVTSTKVISNDTGDESLAFLAEREIKSAKFSPPKRNCVPRAFIFTYKRSF